MKIGQFLGQYDNYYEGFLSILTKQLCKHGNQQVFFDMYHPLHHFTATFIFYTTEPPHSPPPTKDEVYKHPNDWMDGVMMKATMKKRKMPAKKTVVVLKNMKSKTVQESMALF